MQLLSSETLLGAGRRNKCLPVQSAGELCLLLTCHVSELSWIVKRLDRTEDISAHRKVLQNQFYNLYFMVVMNWVRSRQLHIDLFLER